MESNITRKSCFVVAPVEMSVGLLLEQLRKRQIEPFFVSDLLKSGKFSFSQARSIFRSVDLVVAFLVSGHSLSNVFFEIGVAVGAGRPILMFVEKGVTVPTDMRGMKKRPLDRDDVEQQIFEIEEYLNPKFVATELVYSAGATPTYSKRQSIKKADVHSYVQRFNNAWNLAGRKDLPASALLELMGGIGWQVVEAKPNVRAQSPDLAVWIDEIQNEIGNPLIFELKSSLSDDGLQGVLSQLSQYIVTGGAKAGVVLYSGPKLELHKNIAQNVPPIFAFNLEEFTELLEKKRFPAALKASAAAAERMN